MDRNWNSLSYDEQLKWINSAEELIEKGYYVGELGINELAEHMFIAQSKK